MFRYLFAAGLVLLGTACDGDVSGPDRSAGLELSATVSSPTLVAGQPDTITVALENTTPVVVTLHFDDGCQILPFITDADGEIVLPSGGGWGCTAALSARSLAPHETQQVRFVWTGGMQFASEMPLAGALPRGVYYIHASLHAAEAELKTARVPVELQ